MLHVALTGGIAAGKSAVADMLRERGALIIDADAIVRDLQRPGEPGLQGITEAFGEGVLTESGELDRAALGEIVFSDPRALQSLNAIMHPLVRARSREIVQEAAAGAGQDLVVVHDIPLLVESGQAGDFAQILVVQAPLEVRLERMVTHRGMTRRAAQARIDAQATDAQRTAVATAVLRNDSTLEALEEQVEAWWRARGQQR